MVLFSVGLSAAVPCLELMISLVGSFSISCLALVFPPIMEIVANIPDARSHAPSPSAADSKPHYVNPNLVPAAGAVNDGKPRLQAVFDEEKPVGRVGFAWIVFRGVAIISVGVLASVVGTYVVVSDIVAAVQDRSCH